MPSEEEYNSEFNERIIQFQKLSQENKYYEVIEYFKDALQNCRFIRPEYIYCVALAYLFIEDYEHGQQLIDDLFYVNLVPPAEYTAFANIYLSRQKFDEGLQILERALQLQKFNDENYKAKLKDFILKNNLQIENYNNVAEFINS